MPRGVVGDQRLIGSFLDDFEAGTRAIGEYADMLEGLPEAELTRPTFITNQVRREGDGTAQAA